jgi:hypothetical protein
MPSARAKKKPELRSQRTTPASKPLNHTKSAADARGQVPTRGMSRESSDNAATAGSGQSSLETEIKNAQRRVKTDAYQMSIGEIVNMYKDEELIINPDFQRLFRWQIGQKAKLIESLLLGIPIPSIFVFETDDAKWELIDGLQRISTILEFMGLLRSPDDGQLLPPSALVGTNYLPSLDRVVWQRDDGVRDIPVSDQVELEKNHQLTIRRARLGVEILKKPSDNNAKYDLFQRLNAGGTQANAQELRNCVVIMVNRPYYRLLKGLADLPDFRTVIAATEEQIERQRHLEFATRFLVHTYISYDGKSDIEDYIDRGIVQLASGGVKDEARNRFSDTFTLLNKADGENSLRRFDGRRHLGRVGLVAFECIAVGIGKNIKAIRALPKSVEFVRERIRSFWTQPQIDSFLSQGMRGDVLPDFHPVGARVPG